MAIAIDVANESFANASSLTYSHTVTGSNTLLIVGWYAFNTTATFSSVTYNGVAMSQLATRGADGTGGEIYLYGLLNPTTGANNIVISYSGTKQIFACSASYTGVKQSGLPDSSTTNTNSGTSVTTTTTTVADNTWLVAISRQNGGTTVAGTNTFLRKANSTSPDVVLVDSNSAQTPAGSHSLQTTFGSAKTFYHALASFAPAPPAPTSGFFLAAAM